jgi:nicotinamidase-related amidase
MNNALIIVDVQMDYFSPNGRFPLDGSLKAAEAAGRLISHFRENNLPIIHIRHLSPEGFPLLVDGTSGTNHHPLVAPLDGETVVDKRTPNAFFQTELANHLRGCGAKTVTIIGFMANMCVDATARGAREHGFEVEVVPEAVAACPIADVSAKDVKTAFLGALDGFIAKLVPLKEKLAGE